MPAETRTATDLRPPPPPYALPLLMGAALALGACSSTQDHPFMKKVKVSEEGRNFVVMTSGVPSALAEKILDVDAGDYEEQPLAFKIPHHPRIDEKPTPLPPSRHVVGIAIDGTPLARPSLPEDTNYFAYIGVPKWIVDHVGRDEDGHAPLVGLSLDGFPIHGPARNPDAVDSSGGHMDMEGVYHYHSRPGKWGLPNTFHRKFQPRDIPVLPRYAEEVDGGEADEGAGADEDA